MQRIKTSYGIACCRRNKNNAPEILLIQKSNTYAFVIFVLECDTIGENRLRRLFNEMTKQEKMAILEMNYEKIWKKVCMRVPEEHHESKNIIESYSAYIRKKTYFETSHTHDQLKRLMKHTINIETNWDIPKGRKNAREKNLDVAIREFKEETMAPIDKLSIFMHAKPIAQSYIDGTRTYVNYYYLAKCTDIDWCPKLEMFEDAYTESKCVQWFTIEELRCIEKNSKYHKRLINIVTVIFKEFRKLA
jgi:8-oxo-dGTP pyrophosphatase MutT (NUDIX family)